MAANTFGQSYTYKDVKIGGGGFVTGLVFNPSKNHLLYARADVAVLIAEMLQQYLDSVNRFPIPG